MWDLIGVGKITKKNVREATTLTVVKNSPGPNNYLLKDKEAYIVSTSELYGKHGLPRYATSLANELQQFLHGMGKFRISKEIKPSSAHRYFHGVIKQVNK